MKKLIIFWIILLICLNVAIAEQVRVIDKITLEQLTEGYNQHSSPRVYGNDVVWIENDGENIKITHKNLLSGELKKIDSTGIETSGGIRLLNIFDNYIVYVIDRNLWVYDIRKNQEYKAHDVEQGPLIHQVTYSKGKLIYDCGNKDICIYDLSNGDKTSVRIPELKDNFFAYAFAYNYPYLYLEHGLYNFETKEYFEIYFGQNMKKIIDDKLLYRPLRGGTYQNTLNLYDPLTDKEEIYLEYGDTGIEWQYAKEYNKIFVSGSAKNKLTIFDGNQNKVYSITSGDLFYPTNYGLYDDKIVFIMRNENTGPLKHPVDTQVYLARLHFKFVDVEVNETKFPLTTEQPKEEAIIISEEAIGEPTVPKTDNDSNIILRGCTSNFECEESLCEIETGRCVECYNGRCNCQEGFKPCLNNTKCVKTKTKGSGDFYDCEFECKSGLGKNGQCIDPITIKLTATKENVKVGKSTDITVSFDNALDYPVEADLTITAGSGVSISSSEACQSGSRNLCKSFHKIGAKEVKQLSIRLDCIDFIKNIPINGKVTYTAGDLSTTTEETIRLNCVSSGSISFLDKILAFFKSIFT